MPAQLVATDFTEIVGLDYSESRQVVVVLERSGRVSVVDLLREEDGLYETRSIGSGYTAPIGVAVHGPSRRVAVAAGDGLWLGRLSGADRAAATGLPEPAGPVRALAFLRDPEPDPGLAVLSSGGTLLERLAMPPAAGSAVLVPGLDGVSALAVDAAATTVHLLVPVAGGVHVDVADLGAATVRRATQAPLTFGHRIADLGTGWCLVVGAGGEVAAVSDAGLVRSLPPIGAGAPVTAAIALGPDRAMIAAGGSLFDYPVPLGTTDPVRLVIDPAPLFLGAYTPVRLELLGSGLSVDDVVLSVEDEDHGSVSPSRDDTFDASDPHLLLLAGWRPGESTVIATDSSTGETVGRARFSVDDRWADATAGPSFSVTGAVDAPVVRHAWGGGSAGPQNIGVYPVGPVWRVGIVLVDTTTATYPAADLSAIRKDWKDAMVDGVTLGGVTRSVSDYFAETSYGKLSVRLVGNAIAGPLHTTGPWEDYFEVETEPDPANPGMTRPRRWNPKPDTWKAFASLVAQANADAASATPPRPPVLDLSKTDAVAFVVRTASAPDGTVSPPTPMSIGRYVWPQQSTQTVKLDGVDRTIPLLFMPADWTALDGRQLYETLAHELGHTLGLPDLYLYPWMNAGNAERALRDWDLMHRDRGLPQLSLSMRMALGWIAPAEIRSFDFAAAGGAPVLQPVTLQALQTKTIPPGSLRGIEVRIANGRNYYFEYRSRQGASLGDAQLPMNEVVVGVDVVSPIGGQNYDSRPMTLRLYDDPDAIDDTDGILRQGAFLSPGDDYREKDFTEGAPKDFVAKVVAVRPDSADLQIRYDSEARPELSIRPWPNGDKQWQSPDIEVRNAKSDADARWLNVPWGGNPNRLVARVRNRGGVDARDVRASFSIKNLTTNGTDAPPPALEPLGVSDPVTIPAGQVRELGITWVAPGSGHHCIVVDIPLYEEPGDPAIHESSDRDNTAQSNYDRFWSESASPSARKRFTVRLENPTDETAIVYPRVRQTSPFYRTYLEHAWLSLPARQSREIEVMTESLDGDPVWQGFVEQHRGLIWEQSNVLEISGWVSGVCAALCTGGATLEVDSGRATRIEDVAFFAEPGASGVVLRADGKPADNGTVLMTALAEGEELDRQRTATSEVSADGSFFVFLRSLEPGMAVTLHFLGGYGVAPTEAGPFRAEF
ncbi:M6 family metalloprotease domain-containing protein [Rathayibacter oskolensis]|uniref:M6 family metalloprotease domain-containing protein n=1 Tax=Rathayibacter oskolensis TaxID=1891671 RepID=A0A1X7NR39_9MICO|nr:hypothetical protein [Rathayibacter oskolensis]SMH40524.1 M6 family metalloprotease domain-containing protein [Rathayibacter oskolensis]